MLFEWLRRHSGLLRFYKDAEITAPRCLILDLSIRAWMGFASASDSRPRRDHHRLPMGRSAPTPEHGGAL
jgi:hypothetical protein